MRGAARGAGRQGVLAGPCSLPPSGGPARAPARCAAVRRGRGLCGASAAAAASRSVPRGAGPPAPLPRRCAVRACSPSGCCASLRPRAPSFCAGAPRFAPPLPGLGPPRWALRSLRGVLAPLRPRRAAAFGGVARRPGGGGAVPPPAPCSRVSPPSGPAPRRSRSASPGACRRCAASAWGGPAAAGPGGRAAAGGAPGPAAAGPVLGRSRAPRVGFGVCAAAAALFSRLLRRAAVARRPPRFGFARAARPPCLWLRLPSHADGRATAARPFCAFGAFVVQREGELQGITQSATYCVGYSLDIPYTGEFGKTRILPNYLWISSIDTAPYFWYALIRI